MPERCPVCGGIKTVRYVLDSFTQGGVLTRHERRVIEYSAMALEDSPEDVCSKCETVLARAEEGRTISIEAESDGEDEQKLEEKVIEKPVP